MSDDAHPRDPFADVTPIGRRPASAARSSASADTTPGASVPRRTRATPRTGEPDSGAEDPREQPPDQRPAQLQLSQRELSTRRYIGRANQHDMPSAHVTGRGPVLRHPKPHRVLSFAQLEAMASDIATIAYRDVKKLAKSGERKHAATSFAIVTDKLLLLRNRPTQIIAFDVDQRRPGALELAARLASVAREESA